jgi:hypothetical protein
MIVDQHDVGPPDTPERKLWVACLTGGIIDALVRRAERLRAGKRDLPVGLFHVDEQWLMDPRQHHVGSFQWICHNLGMDPEIVRQSAIDNMWEVLKT